MRRSLTPELMDDPALDAADHVRALRALARLNRLARSDAILWPEVRSVARAQGGRASLLDIATGSADVPLGLARRAAREGLALDLAACDASPVPLAEARRRAAAAGVPLETHTLDAVAHTPDRRYDIVTCSLFLHHLDRESALTFLKNAAAAADHALLVSDLRRDPLGLAAAWLASRVMTASPVVRVDALKSVRAAYTIREFEGLAREAGLHGATVRPRWPRRMLLAWRPH